MQSSSSPTRQVQRSAAALLSCSLLLGLRGDGSRRFDERAPGMVLVAVRNGFGQLLPHRVARLDVHGQPTTEIVDITRQRDFAHVTLANPILPVAIWPVAALLPDGLAGNHYLHARFDRPIDVDSVLTSAVSAAASNNLIGTIEVVALDPVTSVSTVVRGRVFIGGRSYGPRHAPGDPSRWVLQRWVELDADGRVRALTIDGSQPGLGFPGTQGAGPYAGARALVADDSIVFVVDSDDDLTTHETFPSAGPIQMRIAPGVRSPFGEESRDRGLASSSVGPDTVEPEVLRSPSTFQPVIEPADGAVDVDPGAHVFVSFTEPVQPAVIGVLDEALPPTLSAAIQIQFGPSAARVNVPFHVRIPSVFDLGRLELVPGFDLPGSGATSCGSFGIVEVRVNPHQVSDLPANLNTMAVSSAFATAEGVGLVNAPVSPDTIYVARGGAISVVDLNGFGQSTGNPSYDFLHPIVEGNSNFPNNPNVALQGSAMVPPLAPGACTFDGGSAGPLTLTRSSTLSDQLVGAPLLESVGDMALGHALDVAFNDQAPFGCQAGGGNLCASTGLKKMALQAGGPNTLAPASTGLPLYIVFGGENPISFAPHPNPPPLVFPPLCLSPLILGQEPTSVVTSLPFPAGPGLTNLLGPGPFPLGLPEFDIPPQGTLVSEMNSFFQGPSLPQPNITTCSQFMIRQRIGHFLYVVDRSAEELVVLDSNRFLVLDRIALADPTSLAMSPNLDLLAVSQEQADRVSFVDVDPLSATFHHVVKTLAVGKNPCGLAWEPGNEDILVCNRGDGSVSVISTFTLEVRKVVRALAKARRVAGGEHLRFPFEVAITPRQLGFGFARGVYFAYLLNTDGTVSVFESGPDGINGIGYDDVVDTLPFTFRRPKAIQVDVGDLNSAVVIAHEDPLDAGGQPFATGGAVTKLGITAGLPGIVPLADPFDPPHLRLLEFGLYGSLYEGTAGLSGIPVDLAFDDQRNLGALRNRWTTFSAGTPIEVNGKGLVRDIQGAILSVSAPRFLFLAVPGQDPGAGVLDVVDMSADFRRFDTNAFHPGIQSIPAPGVSGLMNYFRQ